MLQFGLTKHADRIVQYPHVPFSVCAGPVLQFGLTKHADRIVQYPTTIKMTMSGPNRQCHNTTEGWGRGEGTVRPADTPPPPPPHCLDGDTNTPHSHNLQGGSNMTGTDFFATKPHCAAAVRP